MPSLVPSFNFTFFKSPQMIEPQPSGDVEMGGDPTISGQRRMMDINKRNYIVPFVLPPGPHVYPPVPFHNQVQPAQVAPSFHLTKINHSGKRRSPDDDHLLDSSTTQERPHDQLNTSLPRNFQNAPLEGTANDAENPSASLESQAGPLVLRSSSAAISQYSQLGDTEQRCISVDTVTMLQSSPSQPTLASQPSTANQIVVSRAFRRPKSLKTHNISQLSCHLSPTSPLGQPAAAEKVRIIQVDDPEQGALIKKQDAVIEKMKEELSKSLSLMEDLRMEMGQFSGRVNAAETKAIQAEQQVKQASEIQAAERQQAIQRVAEAQQLAHQAEKRLAKERSTWTARINQLEERIAACLREPSQSPDASVIVFPNSSDPLPSLELPELTHAGPTSQPGQLDFLMNLNPDKEHPAVALSVQAGYSILTNSSAGSDLVFSNRNNPLLSHKLPGVTRGGAISPPGQENFWMNLDQEVDFEGPATAPWGRARRSIPANSLAGDNLATPSHNVPIASGSRDTQGVSTVPKPMSTRRQSTTRVRCANILPPAPIRNDTMTSTPVTSAYPTSNYENMGLEQKVDLIMQNLGIGISGTHAQRDRRARRPHFKASAQRAVKDVDGVQRQASVQISSRRWTQIRATLQMWVRKKMNECIGIVQDRQISTFKAELYSKNMPLQLQMAEYDEDGLGEGPTLRPMCINWNNIHGRWNERLLQLFIAHCETCGYGGGEMDDADEEELERIFFDWINRLNTIVNANRPQPNETARQAELRIVQREANEQARSRQNTRRGELYKARFDTAERRLPEEILPVNALMEEDKARIDRFRLVSVLGLEGMSSDESDDDDSNMYNVKILRWRNKRAIKRLSKNDCLCVTTNKFGNKNPGNRPRTRKQKSARDARESLREAPAGKPINLYDEDWYMGLTPKEKRDLAPKPAMDFLTMIDEE